MRRFLRFLLVLSYLSFIFFTLLGCANADPTFATVGWLSFGFAILVHLIIYIFKD